MRTRGRSLHSLQIKPWAPLRTETAALSTELDSQPEADKLKLLERTETAFIFFPGPAMDARALTALAHLSQPLRKPLRVQRDQCDLTDSNYRLIPVDQMV